jgi:hypothetical protein
MSGLHQLRLPYSQHKIDSRRRRSSSVCKSRGGKVLIASTLHGVWGFWGARGSQNSSHSFVTSFYYLCASKSLSGMGTACTIRRQLSLESRTAHLPFLISNFHTLINENAIDARLLCVVIIFLNTPYRLHYTSLNEKASKTASQQKIERNLLCHIICTLQLKRFGWTDLIIVWAAGVCSLYGSVWALSGSYVKDANACIPLLALRIGWNGCI